MFSSAELRGLNLIARNAMLSVLCWRAHQT